MFGLHEERTSLELGTTCQAPYILVETKIVVDQFLDDHICLSFCAYSLNHGHISDRVFKKVHKGPINYRDPSLRSNSQNLVQKL